MHADSLTGPPHQPRFRRDANCSAKLAVYSGIAGVSIVNDTGDGRLQWRRLRLDGGSVAL